MPIPTDSAAWVDAEESQQLYDDAVEFILDTPSEAYTVSELSDELYQTHFTDVMEYKRLERERGENESDEEFEGLLDDVSAETLRTDMITLGELRTWLDIAVKEGRLEARKVPAEYTDHPDIGEDTLVHYSAPSDGR